MSRNVTNLDSRVFWGKLLPEFMPRGKLCLFPALTDWLRIPHLRIAPPVGNPEVGNSDYNRQGSGLNIDCDLMQELLFFWWQQTSSFSSSLCLARACIEYWLRFDDTSSVFSCHGPPPHICDKGEKDKHVIFFIFWKSNFSNVDWLKARIGKNRVVFQSEDRFVFLFYQLEEICLVFPVGGIFLSSTPRSFLLLPVLGQKWNKYFSQYVFSWISRICHSWSKVSTFEWHDMNWQSLLGNVFQPFHSVENWLNP